MITILRLENEGLKRENAELRAIIEGLESSIALMKGGGNSRTSSTSPSHDLGRNNHNSLRVSEGKKSGGQPGHVGHSFQMSDTPDEIIDHIPLVCEKCEESLQEVSSASYTRRQLSVIEPVEILIFLLFVVFAQNIAVMKNTVRYVASNTKAFFLKG
jgi:hypothetical protein